MPKYSKKRSASMVDSDASDVDMPLKASKKAKNSASADGGDGKDDDGNPFWELSNKRRVGVSQFKKATFINIREYYEKDGNTDKDVQGISLSIEQYTALLKAVPGINAALRELGQAVSDPEESNQLAVVTKPDASKKEKSKPSRSNIEATSDEDED
ncbi:hypothetical protein G7046_g3662 [Stylonectria norvegica]|nr:hypothetical protein G7046_g3662 [Stylonectria norvegica]